MKSLIMLLIAFLGIVPAYSVYAQQQSDSAGPSSLPLVAQSQKFSDLVREDFFAGMKGDRVRFERAMQLCETTLAADPQNAAAMVWHGAGTLIRAEQARYVKDFEQAAVLFQSGLNEMDRAVALAPDNPSVLLPQGATLLSVSAAPLPSDTALKLLQQGVQDYERVLSLQKSYFATLPLHARGELLSGLADGWHRLGDEKKAREYYQLVIRNCAGSSYAKQGEMWLNNELPANRRPACQGCHND